MTYAHFVMEGLEFTKYNRMLVGDVRAVYCSSLMCINKGRFGAAVIVFSDHENLSGRLISRTHDDRVLTAVLDESGRLFCCDECYLREIS